ncbi:glycine--tRNA ligase beta subunit [Paenibacillus antibioticophila]|uniref:Glycine--tRNA ligase beta subunit n=1 Tax=Paenibacillus antibioticophila TaxID=1274374 RepID=A0A920CGA4_9BACL|nr:glycine--tRNA ligase subunit beta [Paenibacillus antibioticophila]GIO39116.1 glycine--tRNA ligase beta subunit [Paenibacillus antibioticophila]
MAKDLLFEIGLEEMPARFIRAAMEQLKDRMSKWLGDSVISYDSIDSYATPRRLAVLVKGVAEKQKDVHEEVKGPSRKIALDESGSWSKAALGFARSQGVDPDQFVFRELSGTEYIYVSKSREGVETSSLLSEGLLSILHAMNFPKNMRWGSYDFKFVRPIRWMVALFGSEIIDLEIAGVKSGNVTRGHRFLGQDTVIASPGEYVETLRAQHVIADIQEREAMITSQIADLAKEQNWNIAVKEDLLEEVLFLVETPTVLFGKFEESFLNIPQEVLITSMREHQRYFPVLNAEGALLPFFVTVRNGDNRSLDLIARGNEKVLRARLSDAKFFYEEDQKLAIKDALSKLESIVFHEELGTVGDKVRRIRRNSEKLTALLGADSGTAEAVSRTAEICKFDLVTQMVYEFPELQGVMGEDYARKAGESDAVAKAIFEHYQPRFAGDDVPASQVGSIVSIADKLDTIAGCFSIGIIPTGSQDPYGLRRQAAGIVQIILEHQLEVQLSQLFELAIETHAHFHELKRSKEEMMKDLLEFFGLRVRKTLSDHCRYDVVDAVMGAGYDDVVSVVARGSGLMEAVERPEFKTVCEAFGRVSNLASKASAVKVRSDLLHDPAEAKLYQTLTEIAPEFRRQLESKDASGALTLLASLQEAINAFFDAVMVMTEDEQIRTNRLALLSAIDQELKQFADFGKLVWA